MADRRVGQARRCGRPGGQAVEAVGQVDGVRRRRPGPGTPARTRAGPRSTWKSSSGTYTSSRGRGRGPSSRATRRPAPAAASFQRPDSPSERLVGDLRVVVDEADPGAGQGDGQHGEAGAGLLGAGQEGDQRHAMMSRPPIVGVPCLVLWPAGPSSRMCWPSERARRKPMNCPPRMIKQDGREDAGERGRWSRDRPRRGARGRRCAMALSSTTSPGCSSAGSAVGGRVGVGEPVRSRLPVGAVQ